MPLSAAGDGGATFSSRLRRETEGVGLIACSNLSIHAAYGRWQGGAMAPEVGLVACGDLCFALELRSSSHRKVSSRLRRETEGVGLVACGDLCFALELRSSSHRKVSSRLRRETEGVGFEPTETCASSVFKTDALNRSATPPLPNKGKIIRRPRGCPSRGAAPRRPSASSSAPKKTAARDPDGGCEFMIGETYSSFCCTSSPTAFTPSPTCSTALPAALSVSLLAS